MTNNLLLFFFTGLGQIVSKHNFTEQSLSNLYIYQLLEKRATTHKRVLI